MITLTRLEEKHGGTWGILTIQATAMPLFTCELPWLENKRNISCIPEGVYDLEKINDDKWLVCRVPHRSGILIHVGNFPSEIRGCILLGLSTGKIDGKYAVLNSQKAMNEFNRALSGTTKTRIKIKTFKIPYQLD